MLKLNQIEMVGKNQIALWQEILDNHYSGQTTKLGTSIKGQQALKIQKRLRLQGHDLHGGFYKAVVVENAHSEAMVKHFIKPVLGGHDLMEWGCAPQWQRLQRAAEVLSDEAVTFIHENLYQPPAYARGGLSDYLVAWNKAQKLYEDLEAGCLLPEGTV